MYQLFGIIGGVMTAIRVIALIAIFAYGLVRARPSRRQPLILAGSLMLGALLLGLLPGLLVGAIGLGGMQVLQFVASLLDLAGLLVLVLAVVRSDDPEPSNQHLGGQNLGGWSGQPGSGQQQAHPQPYPQPQAQQQPYPQPQAQQQAPQQPPNFNPPGWNGPGGQQ